MVSGEHCQKVAVSNPTHACQRFTWSKTWCDRQQLQKAVITGDMVFFVILAVARMVIWETRNKGLYEGENFSYRDLILFFRHLLRVKIRCDRRRLDRITFSKRWVHAASLVVCKGATLESSFPPLPAHGDDGPCPSGPHPG